MHNTKISIYFKHGCNKNLHGCIRFNAILCSWKFTYFILHTISLHCSGLWRDLLKMGPCWVTKPNVIAYLPTFWENKLGQGIAQIMQLQESLLCPQLNRPEIINKQNWLVKPICTVLPLLLFYTGFKNNIYSNWEAVLKRLV